MNQCFVYTHTQGTHCKKLYKKEKHVIDHVILHNNFLLACCSDISFLFSQICTAICTCIFFLFLDLASLRPPSVVLLHFPSPSSWRKPKKSYSIFSVCCRPPPPPLGLPSPHGETGHVRFPAPKIAEVVAAAAEVKRKGNRREGEKELLCSHAARELACLHASVRCNIRAERKSYICSPPF